MTLQEIAKELLNISWVTVQCDDIYENHKVAHLLHEIEKLSKEDGLRLMLHVIEVKGLMLETDDFGSKENPFSTMSDFPHIDSTIKNYPTNEFNK